MNLINYKHWCLLGLVLIYCWLPVPFAKAASLNLTSSESSPAIGQEVQIVLDLTLESSENINAIAGHINWPKDLELMGINDAGSIVSLWIQRPSYDGHQIVFSGLMPGGYQGSYGPGPNSLRPGIIFKIKARPKNFGWQVLEVRDLKLYANDGSGTVVKTSDLSLIIKVDNDRGLKDNQPVEVVKDEVAPQGLTASIEKNVNVADGQWFVAFSAYDQESGIKDFYIDESRTAEPDGDWLPVGSPFVLQDQTRSHYVWIKAVDWNGNETKIGLAPSSTINKWRSEDGLFNRWWLVVILFPLTALIIYLIKKIKRPSYD